MNSTEILKLAVYAGEIMLSNGAETYRVEDTMERIMNRYHMTIGETFVTTTGIFATVEDSEQGVVTIIKRIRKRTYHLGKVALVNDLSRQFVSGDMNWNEAMAELKKIDAMKPYPAYARVGFSSIACFCFTGMLGGNFYASCVAFVIGTLQYSAVLLLLKKKVSEVPVNIAGGCIIAIMALLIVNIFTSISGEYDKIIIGSIMPLVPGVGLTNAIRDVLEGDYLSGASRILDAALVAVCIATGVGTIMSVWIFAFGGITL